MTPVREKLQHLYKLGNGKEGWVAWSATELCVSEATIYSWVSGRRNPSPLALRAIDLLEHCIQLEQAGEG